MTGFVADCADWLRNLLIHIKYYFNGHNPLVNAG